MKQSMLRILALLAVVALASCTMPADPTSTPQPKPTPTETGSPPIAVASPETTAPADPFDLVSEAHLLAFVEDLAGIQPYSGWRNSASQGEAEALDYVTKTLSEFEFLAELGLELERQSFHVFLSTELGETRLHLSVDGQEVEVPADGLRGPRDDAAQAQLFDSDGMLNDETSDPVVVEGPVVTARSEDKVRSLRTEDLQGKVIFLDYAVIDRSIMETSQAVGIAAELLQKRPAGLVLITTFSNKPGESHGTFVGDNSALNWAQTNPPVPTLYARLEDLAPAGIIGWDDLERIETARLTWDADVFAPGESGNLVAHIPGADPSRAVILGAHIDSPNAPGALDDGSGSAALLEVARVLDASRTQPPTDLYLAWFGSEELGLYGASHFVATHQEVLDRAVGMLQMDMLSRPLDGLPAELNLVTWSYGQLGDSRLLWPDHVTQVAAGQGIETVPQNLYHVYSDNNTFGGFDVPHADLILQPITQGSVHYASHIHDPYDTVELVREVSDLFAQMVRVQLGAVLEPPQDLAASRVTPRPAGRIVLVGSHTEATHMSPVGFTELGMAWAMESFDVDLIPYGQAVTTQDLEGANLVVALPVLDYPLADNNQGLYDEAWTEAEIAALERYVADGGLLVLTNSARRIKYGNQGLDTNEDWSDANALASRFGVTYREGAIAGSLAQTEGDHPLAEGVRSLELGGETGLPFSLEGAPDAQILAWAGKEPVVALVAYGDAGGQVLVLADVGILAAGGSSARNLAFWQNLARYTRR